MKRLLIIGVIGSLLMSTVTSYAAETFEANGIEIVDSYKSQDLSVATFSAGDYELTAPVLMLHSAHVLDFAPAEHNFGYLDAISSTVIKKSKPIQYKGGTI